MEALIVILYIVWGILCLILFFKIWGATNDIAEMKDMMQQYLNPKNNNSQGKGVTSFDNIKVEVGDTIVRVKDGKEYEVVGVRDDSIVIDLGEFSGLRTLQPEDFILKK